MNEVVKFLTENPIQFFSTVGLDGNPKVRPFQFMFESNSKLYFCTGNDKNVYKELVKNPNVQICSCSPEFKWVRVSAKVVFTKDTKIKEAILKHSPFVESIYRNPANPTFEALYLDEVTAVFYDFSDNPPKTVKF
ncbi:MAG: pyridoxamine 5'-phosphate oxidase family protein [Fusobacteriaceae bacterium]|jgi:uncharacterized pyridoxamine 5'-phosphate oxidase family protein|nr:pyridoxamine 5'-phosphate oxidase family protein [Fusobacteriaceae bacterium]